MLSQRELIMLCYAERMTMNHVMQYWASGFESWCVILSQWLWIICVLCWTSDCESCLFYWAIGCESWYAMLSQWLRISVCYSEPVFVKHCVLCWASGSAILCAMLSQWLWIELCYAEPVTVNYVVLFCASRCDSILKRQTSSFHYGSKVPAVTITVFITILEQNR
jgi:hypothetical protein